MKKQLLAIVGPTASGKTALGVQLAKQLHTEVLSADSMQIYREMNIGTAKPLAQEMDGVKHHLLDVCDPWKNYSCADWVAQAGNICDTLLSKGKMPVVCGGTGLYLDSLLHGNHFGDTVGQSEIREALQQEFETQGIDGIYARLQAVDPTAGAAIHPNNTKRVIRALEIYLATGKTKTQWDAQSREKPDRYSAVILFLDFSDREKLRQRIGKRVDEMFLQGLPTEVRTLWEAGKLPGNSTAAQAIGYKELIAAFRGESSMDEAKEQIKTATVQYAKRQLTYFRRMKNTHRLLCDGDVAVADAARQVLTDEHIL